MKWMGYDNAPAPVTCNIPGCVARHKPMEYKGFHKIPSTKPIVPRMKKGMNILPFDFTIGDEYPRYAKLYREVLMKK